MIKRIFKFLIKIFDNLSIRLGYLFYIWEYRTIKFKNYKQDSEEKIVVHNL